MGGRFTFLLVAVVVAGLAGGAYMASLKPATAEGGQSAGMARSAIGSAQTQGGSPAAAQGGSPAAAQGGGPAAEKDAAQATPAPGKQGQVGFGQGQAAGAAGQAGRAQGQGGAEGRSRPLAGSVASVDGNTLTLNTQQGEVKIQLAGARIQKTVEGSPEDLKPGQRVVVSAQQGADGSYTASGVQIAPAEDPTVAATPEASTPRR